MALPDNVLVQILESLYADFLESIDIEKHHCSLLHPCISISESTSFNPIHTFRLVSSNWNKAFLVTAKLDRYGFHRIVQVQDPNHRDTYIYGALRKSVAFRRYRIFQNLDIQHGNFSDRILIFVVSFQLDYVYLDYRTVVRAYDFGVASGCEKSREVIIKAWRNNSDEDYETERDAYKILSASPMKGCPSLIESITDLYRNMYALVLEKLGPSLEELYNLMSIDNQRFDEKMSLALAIQMVRDISFSFLDHITHILFLIDKA